MEGERRVYVDGELDDLEIAAKPDGTFNVNDTTIGGILRAIGVALGDGFD